MLTFRNSSSNIEIAESNDDQQQKIEATTLVEEIVREKRNKEKSSIYLVPQAVITYHEDKENKEKRSWREKQRFTRIVEQNISYLRKIKAWDIRLYIM